MFAKHYLTTISNENGHKNSKEISATWSSREEITLRTNTHRRRISRGSEALKSTSTPI